MCERVYRSCLDYNTKSCGLKLTNFPYKLFATNPIQSFKINGPKFRNRTLILLQVSIPMPNKYANQRRRFVWNFLGEGSRTRRGRGLFCYTIYTTLFEDYHWYATLSTILHSNDDKRWKLINLLYYIYFIFTVFS